jgi:hypothetical protein
MHFTLFTKVIPTPADRTARKRMILEFFGGRFERFKSGELVDMT